SNETKSPSFPYDGIVIDYHYDGLPKFSYKVKDTVYSDKTEDLRKEEPGTITEPCDENDLSTSANIELLKLHGSINFPAKGIKRNTVEKFPTIPVDNAYILPPLLNKWVLGEELDIWRIAIERLREAKNIVIVGYSLPYTDIYMQYFFKAGLGPNVNLSKITVFNPVLSKDGNECTDMEERYGKCFSPQLQNRILFRPFTKYSRGGTIVEADLSGTFLHFSRAVGDDRSELFF
ncbi:MAG: hypothetical protein WCC12_11015, partial [Anaerolineales bacterium]